MNSFTRICVAAVIFFCAQLTQSFPTSVATDSSSDSSSSSPTATTSTCQGGITEENNTLVCSLQIQLSKLIRNYKNCGKSINPVWYGQPLNDTLTGAANQCRLPFHQQLNVYNHLFVRVKALYTHNRKFRNLSQTTIDAISNLQDNLQQKCQAQGEEGCSQMDRSQAPEEASNAVIDSHEDAANTWGLGLAETLLQQVQPLHTTCLSARRRRRRGDRKDRSGKRRLSREERRRRRRRNRHKNRKDRLQRKNKRVDESLEKEGRSSRAERRERRRNRRKQLAQDDDDDNSTELIEVVDDEGDNNDEDEDEVDQAVAIATNDVDKDVDTAEETEKADRRERKKARKNRNKNKRRDRKNRDKKRRKSKGRRNRRGKSSSS